MKRLILAVAFAAAPTLALAASPQQASPLLQACAQEASQQMQQAIVWHSQLIEAQAEIARLTKALDAQKKPKSRPVKH